LSLDTEQIWGYMDAMTEDQFRSRFPGALEAHKNLLSCLRAADISATWFLVGGMALRNCAGARDPRLAGLPPEWAAKVPAGDERTAPLWYSRSFVKRLRAARPVQEIGLHGGLTHFIWTGARATRDAVRWELGEGVKALEETMAPPVSFSFGRNAEAYHELLPAHGIRSYRGRPPVLAYKLGRTVPGALLRILDELACATPPPVWPQETLPGLWNIPSSAFLYPINRSRAKIAALRTRVERFSRGVEAAARSRGIFHFCLHPENLAESARGSSIFEDIVERLIRARGQGDIEILTMSEVAGRMEARKEPARKNRAPEPVCEGLTPLFGTGCGAVKLPQTQAIERK
jgi:hypothetical protein